MLLMAPKGQLVLTGVHFEYASLNTFCPTFIMILINFKCEGTSPS